MLVLALKTFADAVAPLLAGALDDFKGAGKESAGVLVVGAGAEVPVGGVAVDTAAGVLVVVPIGTVGDEITSGAEVVGVVVLVGVVSANTGAIGPTTTATSNKKTMTSVMASDIACEKLSKLNSELATTRPPWRVLSRAEGPSKRGSGDEGERWELASQMVAMRLEGATRAPENNETARIEEVANAYHVYQ